MDGCDAMGVLCDSLVKFGSARVAVESDPGVPTGETITAHDCFLRSDGILPPGVRVWARCYAGKWRVIAAGED